MGRVYEAFDREHGMRVALKSLPRSGASILYRFKQEFRNLTGVVHPNIASLYELFAVDDHWFFTMEFVEGLTFLDYVRYGDGTVESSFENSLTESSSADEPTAELPAHEASHHRHRSAPALVTPSQYERLRLSLRQLSEGIEALHSSGKLHRDIKPSNVLVTPQGRVVLLDFGLSVALGGEDVDSRAMSGTISYMAPEQADGSHLGAACDWYAVGVMLYEALSGALPFEGSVSEILLAKRRDPPDVRSLAREVPADLDRLCFDLIQSEPGKRPEGQQVVARLGGEAGHARVTEPVELIGRSESLQSLRESFDEVERGASFAIFVHGASGEGKSALVDAFFRDVTRRNRKAVVLSGRCYEAESVPYKALDSLIDSLANFLVRNPKIAERVVPADARALTRIFPVLGKVRSFEQSEVPAGERSSDQEARRQASGALRELLSRLGESVPLILAIDDLQWGDLDSGMILSEILHTASPPRLLFIGMYRSEHADVSPILRLLRSERESGRGAQHRELKLGVLSEEDSRLLARQLLGPPEQHLGVDETIARESGGVPYFIHELARFVRSGARLEGGKIALEEVIALRVSALPAAPRALLETIALAGQPIRHRDAYDSAGLHGEDRGAATLLRGELLVRSTGPGENDRVEPYHDRLRETIVARMPAGQRQGLHERLATTLEASGTADPETLAVHFRGGGAQQKAAHYYAVSAGEAAQALAFDRAAKLYQQALDLHDPSDGPTSELRISLGDALANAGRGFEAARVYESAVPQADSLVSVDLRRRAAYQYCVSGHLQEGRAAMSDLLARYDISIPHKPSAIIATLLFNRLKLWFRGYKFKERKAVEIDPEELTKIDVVWSAAAGLSINDIIAGAGLQTRALLLALESGELDRIARSIAWEATHKSNDGSKGWKETAKLLELSQQLAQRSGHPHALGMATMSRGIAEFTMGRWATTVPLLDEADAIFRSRCTGVTWELDTAHAFALWALIYKGDFVEMSRRTESLLREAEDRGDLYAATTIGVFHQPHALLMNDDVAAARLVLDRARKRWTTSGFYLQDLCALMTDALIDTYENEGATGFARYEREWSKVKASQLLRSQAIRSLTHHFRARTALAGAMRGERSDLLDAAEADAGRIAKEGVAWCEPYATVLFAGAEKIRGNLDAATRLYRESIDGFERVNMTSHATSAKFALGELVGGEEGARLLHEAESWMTDQQIQNPRAMSRLHVGAVA